MNKMKSFFFFQNQLNRGGKKPEAHALPERLRVETNSVPSVNVK